MMANSNREVLNKTKKSFEMAWQALFMLSGIKNIDLPLSTNQLMDTKSDIVKILIKIYTMESFIVYKLNETSYK